MLWILIRIASARWVPTTYVFMEKHKKIILKLSSNSHLIGSSEVLQIWATTWQNQQNGMWAQQRLRCPGWSFCWTHMPFCWFCHEAAHSSLLFSAIMSWQLRHKNHDHTLHNTWLLAHNIMMWSAKVLFYVEINLNFYSIWKRHMIDRILHSSFHEIYETSLPHDRDGH